MDFYFSDREKGPRPRVEEEISQAAWGGIISIIRSRIVDASFGYRFPEACPDGLGPCGCDEDSFILALNAEIPEISWPLKHYEVPPNLAILDLIEFCFRSIGKPIQGDFHNFFRHYHLKFDPESGQTDFRIEINRILSRNGLAYELGSDGMIIRLSPDVLREGLTSAVFHTGDGELDSLLEAARTKFLDPDLTIRKESLEKLWDAWERLKTIEEPGKDKKTSTKTLLDRTANEPNFREVLEREAKELTDIGNNFRIRHSEVTKVPLQNSEQVDYLFHRMFSLIRLILRATGRGG
jgi:hypothetical protein